MQQKLCRSFWPASWALQGEREAASTASSVAPRRNLPTLGFWRRAVGTLWRIPLGTEVRTRLRLEETATTVKARILGLQPKEQVKRSNFRTRRLPLFGTFDSYPYSPMLGAPSDTERALGRSFATAVFAFVATGSASDWLPYAPAATARIRHFG
ncbi:hypothetical protein ACFVRU_17465 [Streptomyces sp. NPDC057927]